MISTTLYNALFSKNKEMLLTKCNSKDATNNRHRNRRKDGVKFSAQPDDNEKRSAGLDHCPATDLRWKRNEKGRMIDSRTSSNIAKITTLFQAKKLISSLSKQQDKNKQMPGAENGHIDNIYHTVIGYKVYIGFSRSFKLTEHCCYPVQYTYAQEV